MQREPSAVNNLGPILIMMSLIQMLTHITPYYPAPKTSHILLSSDNIPAIRYSNLNADAEEYIPTGTSNHNACFNDAINPRVSAIVAVAYVLAMLTLHSLGKVKPYKEHQI